MIANAGYATFGASIHSDVLTNYAAAPAIALARVAVCFSVSMRAVAAMASGRELTRDTGTDGNARQRYRGRRGVVCKHLCVEAQSVASMA